MGIPTKLNFYQLAIPSYLPLFPPYYTLKMRYRENMFDNHLSRLTRVYTHINKKKNENDLTQKIMALKPVNFTFRNLNNTVKK